jgi:nanoRNase/pAp phosphatase (c-di-AMP/oligoRNAs hydrolase)
LKKPECDAGCRAFVEGGGGREEAAAAKVKLVTDC